MARRSDTCIDTSGRAKASSDTRQFVGRQGGRLSEKLSPPGVMPRSDHNPKSALWCAHSNAARDSESVLHAGNAEYPDRKTEEGHGEKGIGFLQKTEARRKIKRGIAFLLLLVMLLTPVLIGVDFNSIWDEAVFDYSRWAP